MFDWILSIDRLLPDQPFTVLDLNEQHLLVSISVDSLSPDDSSLSSLLLIQDNSIFANLDIVSHIAAEVALNSVLGTISSPIHGQVSFTDSSSVCVLSATVRSYGPCVQDVPFNLTLVRFQSPCPGDVFIFTAANQSLANWTAPVVVDLSGMGLPLSSTLEPGILLARGTYELDYDGFRRSSANFSLARYGPVCSFTVRY
jgi:hypothetical protein